MPSRRRLLANGAGLLAAGLAGCTGGTEETTTTTTTEADGSEATDEAGETATEGPTPYTVEVEPSDPYTFEEVPETYGVMSGAYLDMGMALGIHPSATTGLERAPLKYYEILDGVSFDESRVTKLASGAESGYDKENFYAADSDVWLIDPRTLQFFTDWDESDIREIESRTGPFLGSSIRFGPTAGAGQESYYTLYEAFEKVATVFQRQKRFEAWQSLHDDLMSTIEEGLPPEDERPTVAAIWRGVSPDSGQFRIAPLHRLQNNTKSYLRVGMKDAFEGNYPDGPIGYEALLDVDPDYIGAVGGLTSLTREEFVDTIVEPFENNENGQRLTAVQEGNVIRSGGQFMGPIVDLYSTEAVAKMVYPEEFGEWPGPVGELSEDERLFDRGKLSDVINGNL